MSIVCRNVHDISVIFFQKSAFQECPDGDAGAGAHGCSRVRDMRAFSCLIAQKEQPCDHTGLLSRIHSVICFPSF